MRREARDWRSSMSRRMRSSSVSKRVSSRKTSSSRNSSSWDVACCLGGFAGDGCCVGAGRFLLMPLFMALCCSGFFRVLGSGAGDQKESHSVKTRNEIPAKL